MRHESGLEMEMRDGTVLRADAWLPDSGGPVPAVLSRTPYDRTLGLTPVAALDPERAVAAGLAMVCQDVRGQHGSEGRFTPFESEGPDGHDSVEWVAAQDWCDGRVAMSGRSYAAATQWRAALEQPEHLAAIFPVVVGCDPYDGWLYGGGAFELGFNLFWVHLMTNPKSRSSLDESYWHLPLTEPPLLDESPAGAVYREWLAHPTYDDHWRRLSPRGRHDRIKVPVFNVGGWFDIFLGGTIENHRSVPGSRLLIGPWAHGSAFGPYPDHAFKEFGAAGQVDLAELQLAFFREHLLGEEALEHPPVRLFVMGENRWRDEPEWPLARARDERWHLHSGGALSPEAPAPDAEPDEFGYDPRDPAPTIGGPTSLPGRFLRTNAGPLDQRPLEERPDVLAYTSEPLDRPLEVTGPLALVLHAATSAPDTDWIGKLCDVDPDGTSRILAEGVLRARFREGFEAERPVEPDVPHECEIDLVATCNVFQPGHRIRLLVTSSSFPRIDRNAGSGLPLGRDTERDLRPARQRIFHDASRPSHLRLPVVPR
ncbi:MAG TPA: CocE/NonD family hydrolase [Thermoleophilaceae bacterium]|nr:CocE/NonD family hydrolase [Thermoleophilaceae bacterium]